MHGYMLQNSLIAPIVAILKTSPQAIKEYDLIQMLEQNGIEFPFDGVSNEVALFKKHFLVMNALYQLQNDLLEDGYFLTITSLEIKIDEIKDSSDSKNLIDHTDMKLSEYYLDWDNYENTSEQDVKDLLKGFWEKYFSQDKKAAALKILDLESDVSLPEVKQVYRRLAAQHHPDKGGCHKRFIEIREAYEILKCCL